MQVFVSSQCYELRDLRSVIRDFLLKQQINPQLSDDIDFPTEPGKIPYVTCLQTLEECPLVIGIIEKAYGTSYVDWGQYKEYSGLSPTHAELRHTITTGKTLLLYVNKATMAQYVEWCSDQQIYEKAIHKHGPDIKTLKLIHELKHLNPAPYIMQYSDAAEVIQSLEGKLLNEICKSFKNYERKNRDQVGYIVDQVLNSDIEIQQKVHEKLNPILVKEYEDLKSKHKELETKLTEVERTQDSLEKIQTEKVTIEKRINALQEQLNISRIMLASAAVRDTRWLERIRTQLMPKQNSRVPFHNDAEVAIRGYHCSNMRGKPKLLAVTWAQLPYNENGLHRGYKAGLIFNGSEFSPGITWAQRQKDKTTDQIRWLLPNIYFGDYLEVSTGEDPDETPLCYRGSEFAVRNPQGELSDWIEFSFSFDDQKLKSIMMQNAEEGHHKVHCNDNQGAIEPLRKAMVFSQFLIGGNSEETIKLRNEWNDALDNATRAKLRFREGTRICVISGTYSKQTGVIEKIGLRQSTKHYWIKPDNGDPLFPAGDDEVDILNI